MAEYPIVYNFNTGKTANTESRWTNRSSSEAYSKQHTSLTPIIFGAAALSAGFIPINNNKNVWNYYNEALRYLEEYSPAGIARTFNLSSFFSQFEKSTNKFISPQSLTENSNYLDYLTRLVGEKDKRSTRGRLLEEGVTLKKGQLFWGEGDDVALKYASRISSPNEISITRLQSSYSKIIGSKFSAHEQIIGGQNLPQYIGRQASMLGTEYVGRFNRLLEAPFEMEPFKTIFGGTQKAIGDITEKYFNRRMILDLAVKEGTGSEMLGRLALKYGGGLTAGILAYKTLDWAARESSLLNDTSLDEGITHGIGSIGVQANLLASRAAELTGLHAYREKQEEIAPGSTELKKLLAFPLMGAAGGGLVSYLWKIGEMANLQYNQNLSPANARKTAEEKLQSFLGKEKLADAARNLTTRQGLYSREDSIGKLFKKIATPDGDDLSFKFLGKLGPTKLSMLIGAAIGITAIAPFLPGALVPSTRPDELKDIYSGRKEVAIRKGRWWEFGRSPYEGSRIMYYRPHWYAKQAMHAREKAIWEDAAQKSSPLSRWFKQEFTYELEQKHYKDRPYPITSLPFEDIPLVGPLLANTIGRLIKPPVLMHTEEWQRGDSVKTLPKGFGQPTGTEIGELTSPQPISPYDIRGTLGEQAYRFTEMIGLPGYAMTSVKQALTGSQDLFDRYSQLESSRRMFGTERAYWDEEIGGGLGTTEALRRLYPHRRKQIELYNPIRNTMPDWLPGPGERGPDLLHGDPYVKVQEGELRLPGKGYEARFKELEGINPEDYPLIHQYKILADVAPYTDKFDLVERQIRSKRERKSTWSDYEQHIWQQVKDQRESIKNSSEQFREYQYLSPVGEIFGEKTLYDEDQDPTGTLGVLNKMKEKTDPGLFSKLFGGYWEYVSHKAETPFEQLTPLSPASKLIHERTAIEAYEKEQIFGTENAFWNKPYENFIRPFSSLFAKSLGSNSIPDFIENKRKLEEYFDVLKYTKAAKLSNEAREQGDYQKVKEFEEKKNETLFGVNPFTYNFSSIYRALPSRDRAYFKAFSEADTMEERAKILKLVPENEKGLYIARWKQQHVNDLRLAEEKGFLNQEQIQEAHRQTEDYFQETQKEGLPSNKELWYQYVGERKEGENYADWYRRSKLLSQYNLPGPDWVGWHPQVDLEDIKLKIVESTGQDMHDYDLWQDRVRGLANKPYINEEAIEPILNPETLNDSDRVARIDSLLRRSGVRATISTSQSNSSNTTFVLKQNKLFNREDE